MSLIVLVGLPGSGKTTAGRALATSLGRRFVDTDDVFEQREGVSVQDYLRRHDEAVFREHEVLALGDALTSADVVATGGGVVTTPEARRLLSQQVTVWLDCPADVLGERVLEGDRPLLGDAPQKRLRELRVARDPLYREVSHYRVDSSRPLEDVVAQLTGVLESAAGTS